MQSELTPSADGESAECVHPPLLVLFNQVELSNEEQEILSQVLQRALAALELEILHTDHAEFRGLLKHRRDVLRQLSTRLPQLESAA